MKKVKKQSVFPKLSICSGEKKWKKKEEELELKEKREKRKIRKKIETLT